VFGYFSVSLSKIEQCKIQTTILAELRKEQMFILSEEDVSNVIDVSFFDPAR